MTSIVEIKCDICNKLLDSNEIDTAKGLLNFSGKPSSKYNFSYKDGVVRKGDLCFACFKSIKDFIENLKLRNK